MNHKISLQQFLTRRLTFILIILFIIYAIFVGFINLNAMDDTTEYYMQYEAQVLSEFYNKDDDILEFDKGVKEYYWGVEQLPKLYTQFLAKEPAGENIMTLLEVDSHYIYILPFRAANLSETFFVIHFFDKNAHSYSEKTLHIQLSILFLIVLLAVIFFIMQTSRQVSSQVSNLNEWVKFLNIENINTASLPKSLKFEELIHIASVLAHSYQQQQHLNANKDAVLKREQAFLSTLSHELRTPISIISAACALLDKRNELSEKDKKALIKLSCANNNMKRLTDTLLQLWRNQPASGQITELSLADILIEEVNTSQLDRSIVEITHNNHQVFDGHKTQVSIVISNLLRNAYQYRNLGIINIKIEASVLTVSNQFDNKEHTHDNEDFGFGIGLYLVKKICTQNKWLIQTDTTESIFSVKIQFKNKTIL